MEASAMTRPPALEEAPVPRAPRAKRSRAELYGFHEEWFTGELVLRDLEGLATDEVVPARLILIRFLVAQYFGNLVGGGWPSHLLRLQRSAALNVLGRGLTLDAELRYLRSALEACDGTWRRPVLRLLLRSAAAARVRNHPAGALALYRIAYEAGVTGGWLAEAAGAALEIAGFESLLGDVRTRARWRRRASVLARSADVEAPGP
jgi:hypothetical protein